MAEPTDIQSAKKTRKTRSDKGISRADKTRRETGFRDDVVSRENPPIFVKILLKNGAKTEFGCSKRQVANGFHVFFYPSERDRYRTTRREFAVSEIVEIEITEAEAWEAPVTTYEPRVEPEPLRAVPSGPRIHNARQHAARTMEALATGVGPVRMDELPNMNAGGVVATGGIGDSLE